MDRREFLITTTGAATIAAATGGSALAAASNGQPTELSDVAAPHIVTGTRTLRLAMPWTDNGQGAADSARRLARRIELLSGKRYRIDIVGEASGLDTDADIVHSATHELARLAPAAAYFAGLPGQAGLPPHHQIAWLMAGGGQMLWDDLAGDFGLKPLLAGHTGADSPLWSRMAINGLDAFANLRIYAPGLGAEVARGLGAEPVMLAPADVASALAAGSIDAAQGDGLLAGMAAGLSRAATHAAPHGLHNHGTTLALHVRQRAWDQLGETDQALFRAAAHEELNTTLAEATAHAAILRRALAVSFGIALAPLPAEVTEAVNRVTEAAVAHVAATSRNARRIDQSYMAFRAAVKGRDAIA